MECNDRVIAASVGCRFPKSDIFTDYGILEDIPDLLSEGQKEG